MSIWRLCLASSTLPFQYREVLGNGEVTIDLDEETLKEQVEFFVQCQLNDWKEINRLANWRFPGKQLPSYADSVREHIKTDDQFIHLFGEYLVYWLFLKHISSQNRMITQKKPHMRSREQWLDHLALWRKKNGKFQVVITETKTTKNNPRDKIRRSSSKAQKNNEAHNIFDEFTSVLSGDEDQFLVGQIQELDLELISDDGSLRQLANDVFWKEDVILHGCVISSEVNAGVFMGFDQVANKVDRRRRWATGIKIGSDWAKWVSKVRDLALQYIDTVMARGEF
jgi:hypothetical protein